MTNHNLCIGTKPHIAIVDNDVAICVALVRLFRSKGFAVVAYPSAEAFLALGGQHGALCLILDIHMLGMTGLDLQNHLVSTGHAIPIVFLTTSDDMALRNVAINRGALRVLNKPPAESELFEAVHASLLLTAPGEITSAPLTTRLMMH